MLTTALSKYVRVSFTVPFFVSLGSFDLNFSKPWMQEMREEMKFRGSGGWLVAVKKIVAQLNLCQETSPLACEILDCLCNATLSIQHWPLDYIRSRLQTHHGLLKPCMETVNQMLPLK